MKKAQVTSAAKEWRRQSLVHSQFLNLTEVDKAQAQGAKNEREGRLIKERGAQIFSRNR